MSIVDKNGSNKIWNYNSGIEHVWEDKKSGVRKINNQKEQIILNRQSELFFFISKEEDTVFIVKDSDPEFLEDMKLFGIIKPHTEMIPDINEPISKIISSNTNVLDSLKNKLQDNKAVYVPYVSSVEDEYISQELGLSMYGSSSELIKELNNKADTRMIIKDLGLNYIQGFICSSREELEDSYQKLQRAGYEKCVIKEPYNSAGKGVFFIKDEKQFRSFSKMLRFDKEQQKFKVIIEGWIDNKRDINYQIEVMQDGTVEFLGITEQIISVTAFKGSLYPPVLTKEQEDYYKECGNRIGTKVFQMGFTGILGIDSIIDADGKIYPSIEFNARFNQSTFYIPILNYFKNEAKRLLIRSYDIKTKDFLDYKTLKKILVDKNLYYNKINKEGILILNSTCLSSYQNEDCLYESRIYLACVYDNEESDSFHFDRIDKLLKAIQ